MMKKIHKKDYDRNIRNYMRNFSLRIRIRKQKVTPRGGLNLNRFINIS